MITLTCDICKKEFQGEERPPEVPISAVPCCPQCWDTQFESVDSPEGMELLKKDPVLQLGVDSPYFNATEL